MPPEGEKEDIVVFPHRLDPEKNPMLFDELASKFVRTNWRFIKTKERYESKVKYYEQLSRAKVAVSFADQETWGIAMQEALFCGCIPIVPSRLSYVEMYEEPLRYINFEECCYKVERAMARDPELVHAAQLTADKLCHRGKEAIPNMITEMGRL